MIEGTDGQYYLQAGAILLSGPFLPVSTFLHSGFFLSLPRCF
jgi:hypothetical protein